MAKIRLRGTEIPATSSMEHSIVPIGTMLTAANGEQVFMRRSAKFTRTWRVTCDNLTFGQKSTTRLALNLTNHTLFTFTDEQGANWQVRYDPDSWNENPFPQRDGSIRYHVSFTLIGIV